MSIRLAVFDMAGTTVADDNHVAKAFQEAFRKNGIEIELEAANPLMGYHKPLAIQLLLEQSGIEFDEELIDQIHGDFEDAMIDFYEYDLAVKPITGAEDVFEKLKENGIDHTYLTLHVGAGTFKPVKSEKMADHEMHAEFIDVSKETIQQLINNTDKIIAVGTTSLRTLESLYWLGVKSIENLVSSHLVVNQWEPYETESNLSAKGALLALLSWMQKNKTDRLFSKTQIIIAPGYKPKLAKALITNFHQPQSTLLLLVAALIGDEWRKVYDYALQHNFRFLSYGDGCLLWISP